MIPCPANHHSAGWSWGLAGKRDPPATPFPLKEKPRDLQQRARPAVGPSIWANHSQMSLGVVLWILTRIVAHVHASSSSLVYILHLFLNPDVISTFFLSFSEVPPLIYHAFNYT